MPNYLRQFINLNHKADPPSQLRAIDPSEPRADGHLDTLEPV
jgi:hypothetical protein